jgi:hypothetical protein
VTFLSFDLIRKWSGPFIPIILGTAHQRRQNENVAHFVFEETWLDKFLNELIWMARVLRHGRQKIPEVEIK